LIKKGHSSPMWVPKRFHI